MLFKSNLLVSLEIRRSDYLALYAVLYQTLYIIADSGVKDTGKGERARRRVLFFLEVLILLSAVASLP